MRYFALLSILFAGALTAQEPQKLEENTWADLDVETWEEVWSEEFQAFYSVPKFGDELTALEGKQISITGYLQLIDTNWFILTKKELVSFGCFGGHPEPDEVLEAEIEDHRSYEVGKTVKARVTGVLELNDSDLYHLTLILKDARYELVE